MSDIRTMAIHCLPALLFLLLAAPAPAYVIYAEPDYCFMEWGSMDFGICYFSEPMGIPHLFSVLDNDLVFEDDQHWPPVDLPLTATQVTQAQNGTATMDGNGRVGYRPEFFFTGTDSFMYRACYQDTCSDEVLVHIVVMKNIMYAKDAVDDHYSTPANTPLVIAVPGVRANDDCNAEWEEYAEYESCLVTEPEHGSLTFSHDGAFEYVPHPGFTGTDSFTYRLIWIFDFFMFGDPATVTITVAPETPVPEFPPAFVPVVVIAVLCSCALSAARKP